MSSRTREAVRHLQSRKNFSRSSFRHLAGFLFGSGSAGIGRKTDKMGTKLASVSFLWLAFAVPGWAQTPQEIATIQELLVQAAELFEDAGTEEEKCRLLPRYRVILQRLRSVASPDVAQEMLPHLTSFGEFIAEDCESAQTPASQPQERSSPPQGQEAFQSAVGQRTEDEWEAIRQSISRVPISSDVLSALVDLGLELAHFYFERRKGSLIAHSNRHDDAEANAQGFRKRESENFIIYYRTGDINRAETLLKFAEESVPRMWEVFHHFPDAASKNGEKLPIYLAADHDEYEELSSCSNTSIGCVKHIVYDDGIKQTMYMSSNSYESGANAFEQVENYRKTITHEIAHYTHFDLVSPSNVGALRTWVVEGLASYVAQEQQRLVNLGRTYRAGQVIPLTVLSSYTQREAYESPQKILFYQEGHSVMQMLEDRYGPKTVSHFVLTASQETGVKGAFRQVLDLDLESINEIWFRYLADVY